VCVEGIENEAAFDAVITLGCAIGQGWYFGKPMPAEEARELLAASRRASELPISNVANG
jgi:EAL domain-containing protein (putative c-di-GMP-specific phosphodiesterase class I)